MFLVPNQRFTEQLAAQNRNVETSREVDKERF